jgi:hypothetical protein
MRIPSSKWYLLPWIAGIVMGVRKIRRAGSRDLMVMVIFPVVYASMMYFGRAPRYEWYLLPITLVSLSITAVGLYELLNVITIRWLHMNPRAVSYVCTALVVAATGIYCGHYLPSTLRCMRMAQQNEDQFRRVVGIWLHDNTPRSASVAMEAIGYQGYYSERCIIDMAGLVTPKSIEFKRRARENGQVFDWVLHDLSPDYIVLRSFEVDTNRHFNGGPLFLTSEKEKQFHSTYKEVARFAAPYPDSAPLVRHVTIYGKVSPKPYLTGGKQQRKLR